MSLEDQDLLKLLVASNERLVRGEPQEVVALLNSLVDEPDDPAIDWPSDGAGDSA